MSDLPQDLKQQLEAKRDGYDDELTWQKHLLDGFTGRGGYEGKVKQDFVGFWGRAAYQYSRSVSFTKTKQQAFDTYLDAFSREDSVKFRRRQDVSNYLNYIEPTTSIKIGYLVRKPNKRSPLPTKLQEWIDRTGYDREFRKRALMTAVLGWFPMVVDMAKAPVDAITAEQTGEPDPYATMSLPVHLYDYALDEKNEFLWAKTAITYTRKAAWNAESVDVTRYTIWTRDDVTVYEIVGDGPPGEGSTTKHPFGKVPIVSWRADTSIEDPVKSASINAAIAPLCRRLFNLCSEMDEHIRCQVFAQLIWPGASPAGGESGEGGVSTGLVIGAEQRNVPYYLAPPASVAATIEARMTALIIEIYRISGIEYAKASGVQSSAQSKENEFEKTNVSIASLAQALARADRETLILVGRGLGIAEEELQKIEVVAHESYADAALGDEMAQAMDAVTLQIGRQATVEIMQRLIQKLLPGLSSDKRKIIFSEIEEAVDQAIKDKEAAAEVAIQAAQDPSAVTGATTGKSDHADGAAKPPDESQGIEG